MIKITEEQFKLLLNESESTCLEFKPSSIGFKDLLDYCSAISNEGGGKLILGVSDKKVVIGTKLFKGTLHERNSRMPFQEGFVQREISAFTEAPIREAVLNAVAHRDYKIETASIIIKASPEEFIIESPGGFLPGITPENVIEKSEWRNRRIAEILEKAGLIERSGQGMEVIFGTTIREGKGLPSFQGSDQYSVKLSIPAKVKDEQFIKFLEKVANEKQVSLTFEEIHELENIRENKKVKSLKYKDKFLEMGIIERIGMTSSSKYILSHKWYEYQGKAGIYTRIADLSRDRYKQLIVEHLRKNKKGARNIDFRDALGFDQKTVNNLLQELRFEGKVRFEGKKRTGKWLIK